MSRKKISVAITGGIGSGKSYVCRQLEQYGIPVCYIDDEAKKEMLENRQLQQVLSALVGGNILKEDGSLNKEALAAFLAQTVENTQRVNALVHPAVHQRMLRWVQQTEAPVVAVECALLYESGYDQDMDYVVAVSCPEEVRIQRVKQRSGYTEAYIRKIMARQWTDEQRRGKADFVIENDGKTAVGEKIKELLARLR